MARFRWKLGRASVEDVLGLSARHLAGEPRQGKARQQDIVWLGRQAGRVYLKGRKLRVNKPRLCKNGRRANMEVAVGVDLEGRNHVLAMREGATENAEAAEDLLEHLVSHGVNPERRRLFLIDGAKALRTAINAVLGAETPVQRCRNHKLRNVLAGC